MRALDTGVTLRALISYWTLFSNWTLGALFANGALISYWTLFSNWTLGALFANRTLISYWTL
ncbi:hypothetical protein, partial [Flagellimonas taeanensis]|uniref:hypothetical protein n=1 Tax=Flagellimonas taeanensis TaxID=1005926 RepID=UPI002E7B0AF6